MKKRAFVFEAESTVRLFLAEYLKRRGYDVYAFPHGFSCSVCDGSACADVTFTDVLLSEGSGIEFMEQQRKVDCQNKHMALTASSWTREDQERAGQLGHRIFNKPFTHAELNEWLAEVEQGIAPGRELNSYYLENSPIVAEVY